VRHGIAVAHRHPDVLLSDPFEIDNWLNRLRYDSVQDEPGAKNCPAKTCHDGRQSLRQKRKRPADSCVRRPYTHNHSAGQPKTTRPRLRSQGKTYPELDVPNLPKTGAFQALSCISQITVASQHLIPHNSESMVAAYKAALPLGGPLRWPDIVSGCQENCPALLLVIRKNPCVRGRQQQTSGIRSVAE